MKNNFCFDVRFLFVAAFCIYFLSINVSIASVKSRSIRQFNLNISTLKIFDRIKFIQMPKSEIELILSDRLSRKEQTNDGFCQSLNEFPPASRNKLHGSVIGGCEKNIENIIKAGADVNSKGPDKKGYPTLHYAWKPKIVKILLKYGAKVNGTSNYGSTALHQLSYWYLEIIEGGNSRRISKEALLTIANILIYNGANINARDIFGETPLTKAKQIHFTKMVELLKRRGGIE